MFDQIKQQLIESRARDIPWHDYAHIFAEAPIELLQALYAARQNGDEKAIYTATEAIFLAYEARFVTDEDVEEVISDIRREQRRVA